jgi:diguanylate cyclase (GGDEF)-like protein/PAS domain S-box-containing protein
MTLKTSSRDPANGRHLWLSYVFASTVIVVLVISLACVAFWQEKQRYRERASIAAQNLSRLLDQHISDVFGKIDVVLESCAFVYRKQATSGRVDAATLNAYLSYQESLLPELQEVRILDKDGFVRFGRGAPSAIPVNLSDRELFIRARKPAETGLIIYGPVFTQATKKWVIVFARRLHAADGSFAGVVFANLVVEHFDRFLSLASLGPHGAATVRNAELALIHRYPATQNAVGGKDVSTQLREAVQRYPEGGEYIATTTLDGVERSNAFRKMRKAPFYVIVGLATDDYLGGWKENVQLVSGLAAFAVLITILAAILVYRAHLRLRNDIENRYRAIFETSLDVININRLSDGCLIEANQFFFDIQGYERDEAIGRTASELKIWFDPVERQRFVEMLQRDSKCTNLEARFRRKNGALIWGLVSASVVELDGVPCIISIRRDITERKQAEEKINQLAFFDQITGLPNRTLLQDRLKQAMASSLRNGRYGALLLIDLDHFKSINDTLGHDMGDLLLQQVGRRLTECVREEDTVARLGGDEFVVMLASLSESQSEAASAVELIGEKVIAVLEQAFALKDISYFITASIGASVFLGHQVEIETIMKQADLAMYKAKDAGRNTLRFFDPEMTRDVLRRAALVSDLRKAIVRKQFELHYQAQVTGGRVTGVEALLRWRHPERGLVFPGEFIPAIEETGLILPVGQWVLDTACKLLADWATQAEMAHLTVAVNISACQLNHPDFVEQILMALARSGANPQRLKLELTESLLVNNVEDTIGKMTALKAKGVGFSLDDFGTGYSSLSYLQRLPLDQLKIDQSFVRDILTDPNGAAIAKMIVALAESLGLAVIAEGVETEAQRESLTQHGCHAYQGYFFSRPLPLDEFELFVKRGEANSSPA